IRGYKVVGYIGEELAGPPARVPWLGSLEDVRSAASDQQIELLALAPHARPVDRPARDRAPVAPARDLRARGARVPRPSGAHDRGHRAVRGPARSRADRDDQL